MDFRYNTIFFSFLEPFVQIIQVNPSGKVLKKKRTSIVLDENPSKDPTFNETLNFDLPPNQVEFMSFIVSVYSKLPQVNVTKL